MVFILCSVLALGGAACKGNANSKDFDEGAKDPANLKKGVKPEADAEVAVIEMQEPGYGRIVIELYPNIAPQMVGRFKQLIKEGFYNGTTFHRIDPDLGIIQGGDPLSKDSIPGNDGSGDSPYPNVAAEFSDIPYERGTLGAARKGGGGGVSEEQAYDTANCQFFVTLKRQPAFDKRYTVFGKVIEGLNNADVIMGAPTIEGAARPADPIIIKSITLQPRKQ
jgi:cyclophilin family peptidyl-prolyl cis-trans isomerase